MLAFSRIGIVLPPVQCLLGSVGIGNRLRAFNPRRINHVPQHGSPSGEPFRGEFARLSRTRTHKASSLFKLVDLLDVSRRMAEIGDVRVEHIAFNRLGSGHSCPHIGVVLIGGDKRPLHAYVDGQQMGKVTSMRVRLSRIATVELVFAAQRDMAEKIALIQFPQVPDGG